MLDNITFPFTVELDMNSIWGYEGPSTVTVNNISLLYVDENYEVVDADAEGAELSHISVEHDTTWNIYTDSGFERAISDMLGFDVIFTEQGMQDDGYASMEEA